MRFVYIFCNSCNATADGGHSILMLADDGEVLGGNITDSHERGKKEICDNPDILNRQVCERYFKSDYARVWIEDPNTHGNIQTAFKKYKEKYK